jgi:hypothetical protein
VELAVARYPQPDDVTCGPTCLLQVMHFYGDRRSYDEVLAGIDRNPDGGTLAAFLALAAIRFGYRATIYPYNLRVFDPTWFGLTPERVREKLLSRAGAIRKRKTRRAARAYAALIESGGRIVFGEPSAETFVRILVRGHPIVCGLSSTWLYRQARENPDTNAEDDVAGDPTGHFVVVSGYERGGEAFLVSDPSPHAPFGEAGRYAVPARRLLNSVLLGELTYDAVLLEISPAGGGD